MKRYIAELTGSGLYNLVVVKELMETKYYVKDGKKVCGGVIVDENGNKREFDPNTMDYKEFEDLEECQNFIAFANYH